MLTESGRFLVDAGRWAPCADNSQPWCFRLTGGELGLAYDQARCGIDGFGPDSHATLLAMGAAIENLVQAADAARLEMRWEMPSPDADGSCYFKAQFDPAATIPADARRHPVFSRHTNRGPYKSEPLPEDLQVRLQAMSEASARVRLFVQAEEIAGLARITEQASRAGLRQR